MVKIHARYFGRGPTRARTIWRGEAILVILEEIFIRAEETLIEAGHFDQVRQHRQIFQDEVGPLFCQVVEQAVGRPVRSFLSQVARDGIGAEIFLLGDGAEA